MTDEQREKKIEELGKAIEESMFFDLPTVAKRFVMRRDALIKGRSQEQIKKMEIERGLV